MMSWETNISVVAGELICWGFYNIIWFDLLHYFDSEKAIDFLYGKVMELDQ